MRAAGLNGAMARCANPTIAALSLLLWLVASPAAAAELGAGKKAAARGDYTAALEIWRPLAEQGEADAQYNLGHLYRQGLGVPQDLAEAAKWYARAAGQGVPNAQFNVATMYANGEGVRQDLVLAYMWFSLAAERFPVGELRQQALANRNLVAEVLTPQQIDEARRLATAWEESNR